MKKSYLFLLWAPRILAILFIIFISLFSLDVFGEGYGFWGTLFALFMHLIPSFILVITLWISWKKQLFGGIAFLMISVLFAIMIKGEIISQALITAPIFLTGALFLANYFLAKKEFKN